MKAFMDADFLLTTPTAKALYHDVAETLPIIDYHCHIDPCQIAQNHTFKNLAEAWLGGDHYKWRLVRSNGEPEENVTGGASDYEKFLAFAKMCPKAIGNPLYHWAHLELRRYFDCSLPLCEENAQAIWEHCNRRLLEDASLSVRGIIERSQVTHIATTDDPADTLAHHAAIAGDESCRVTVVPAWRPDKVLHIQNAEFPQYLKKLEAASGVSIGDIAALKAALKNRMAHFAAYGCVASDHGLSAAVFAPASEERVNDILTRRLVGEALTSHEMNVFQYAVLRFLAQEYHALGWVMELHFSALRNANDRMYETLGPDTGFDCIDSRSGIRALPAFLNELCQNDVLPKTIVFSLNPNDNAAIGSIIGCFQGAEAAGKLQHGAAWWFNDTRTGMLAQMQTLAELSLLGNFLGMLTDSRSFLSYTRHEYFRRILCEQIGQWVENGEYPGEQAALEKLVADISYHNAMRYFGFSK